MSCGLYLFWLLHVFYCINLCLMLVFNLSHKRVINKLLQQLNNATDISFLG